MKTKLEQYTGADRSVYTVYAYGSGRELGVVAKHPSGRWYAYGVGTELTLALSGPDPTPHGGPYPTRAMAVEEVAR